MPEERPTSRTEHVITRAMLHEAHEMDGVVLPERTIERSVPDSFRVPSPPRKPASFYSEPISVSAELREFIGIREGSRVSRCEVMSRVTKYIKNNKLSLDSRIIHPDEALGRILLDAKDVGSPLTFLNLGKFMQHHYLDSSDM